MFTSEWDSYAQKTYAENFHDGHLIAGGITKVEARDVPDHDVLLAGFPCQPFSIAGVSKKNALGRPHGFHDETQGTLFFDVCRVIDAKRPRAFLLENVKNLMSHDKGRTFDVIRRALTENLGYQIHYRIIDGAHFTPQHRSDERDQQSPARDGPSVAGPEPFDPAYAAWRGANGNRLDADYRRWRAETGQPFSDAFLRWAEEETRRRGG